MVSNLSIDLRDAVIVASPQYETAAALLATAVAERFGVILPRVEEGPEPNRAVLALGCLVDNAVIRTAYLRYRTLVDRWYPGEDGSVLQSIHCPDPEGAPILVVGGSDSAGVMAAAKRLATRIGSLTEPRLPWLLDVVLGKRHLPLPEDRIDVLGTATSPVITPESRVPDGPYVSAYAGGNVQDHLLRLRMFGPHVDNCHFSRSSQFGLRFLYTGCHADGNRYRQALLTEIQQGVLHQLYHYKSIRMFQLWELLSPSDVFADDDRCTITAAIREYLTTGTGIAAVARIRDACTGKGIFNRHLACDALNLWLGADYFARLTSDSSWREHRDVAAAYFASQAGTDVPITGLTEGYFSYLSVYLEWMVLTRPEAIRDDPHLRQWAERCIGLVANQGTMVVGVQTDEARFGYSLMRQLAFLLADGRYLTIANLREQAVHRGMDRLAEFSGGQAYAGDLVPQPVGDHVGLRVFPANERLRLWQAPDTCPDASFDRAAGRSGWKAEDEYWLAVGMRGGGKALPNVGALAAYERFGVRLIASTENALDARENCADGYSVVTISHEGLGVLPCPAGEVTGRWQRDGVEILAVRMATVGQEWHRAFCWLPGEYLLVVDRVSTGRDRLSGMTHWRCARPMQVAAGRAWSRQTSPEGVESSFFMETDSPSGWSYESRPQGTPGEELAAGTQDLPALHARLSPGRNGALGTATLIHAVAGKAEAAYGLRRTPRGVVVSREGKDTSFGDLFGIGPDVHQVTTRVRTPARLSLAGAGGARDLPPFWQGELAKPSCWLAEGGELFLGLPDGRCLRVQPTGHRGEFWRGESGVTALGACGEDVILGTRSGEILRLGRDGAMRWRHQVTFRPERDFWPWWFLKTPVIAAAASDGVAYVAAGTGSSSLCIFAADTGNVLVDAMSPYGLPDMVKWDAGQFLVGHHRLTPSSAVRAWAPTGECRVYQERCGEDDPRSPGWDMCGLVACDWLTDAAGARRLLLLRHGTYCQLACYREEDAGGEWQRFLGATPVGLAVQGTGKTARVLVADRSGGITSFDPTGQRLSHKELGGSLAGLATPNGQVLAWGDDRVHVLDARDNWVAYRTGNTVQAVCSLGGVPAALSWGGNILSIAPLPQQS